MIYFIDKLDVERIDKEIIYKLEHRRSDFTYIYGYEPLIDKNVLHIVDVLLIKDWFKLEEEERNYILKRQKIKQFRLYAYIPCFYKYPREVKNESYYL